MNFIVDEKDNPRSIYSLKLHENVELEDGTEVMRVPGGWLYHSISYEQQAVFVPYNEEFR